MARLSELGQDLRLPVTPPLAPMLAKSVNALPAEQEGCFWFEPKWDGFRALVFRNDDELEITSRNERPLTRYFPELWAPLRALLPGRCVLDGEIVVPAKGCARLDFDALAARVHPAESRIKRLATETPARFAAFDIVALGDRDLCSRGFAERRSILCEVAAGFRPPLHLSPSTTSRERAVDWFNRFEGAGFDGLIVKPAAGAYEPGKRSQLKLKHRHTAEVVVAGYRMHKTDDGPGSLLLGLFDSAGRLHYAGTAGGFSAAARRDLAERLAPFSHDEPSSGSDGVSHPWLTEDSATRRPGAPNRWRNDAGSSDWRPVWGDLVAEVTYDAITAGRFRHNARLVRWRPDRSPESCSYDQLDHPPPAELGDILDGRGV